MIDFTIGFKRANFNSKNSIEFTIDTNRSINTNLKTVETNDIGPHFLYSRCRYIQNKFGMKITLRNISLSIPKRWIVSIKDNNIDFQYIDLGWGVSARIKQIQWIIIDRSSIQI